jgi:hypothetical protein
MQRAIIAVGEESARAPIEPTPEVAEVEAREFRDAATGNAAPAGRPPTEGNA